MTVARGSYSCVITADLHCDMPFGVYGGAWFVFSLRRVCIAVCHLASMAARGSYSWVITADLHCDMPFGVYGGAWFVFVGHYGGFALRYAIWRRWRRVVRIRGSLRRICIAICHLASTAARGSYLRVITADLRCDIIANMGKLD
jgi:hypothetical protein